MRSFMILLLVAARVSAQPVCSAGTRVPDLGYGFVTCHDCIGSTMQGGVPITRYTGSPAIFQVRANGPAAGKLFDGDTLVSVNGNAITSIEAAIALSTWKDGPITLGVRRGGTLRSVAITPASTCVPSRYSDLYPRVTFAPWRVVRGDSMGLAYTSGLDSVQRWVAKSLDTGRFVLRRDSLDYLAWGTAFWQQKNAAPFGMELRCADCTLRMIKDKSIWAFGSLPMVANVETNSFAARLGLRRGDTLVAVNGLSLLTTEGSTLLSEGSPSGQVTLAWRRDGMALSAGGALPPQSAAVNPLWIEYRYDNRAARQPTRTTQTVGNTTVEIKSPRATSTFDPATNQLRIVIGTDTVLVTAKVRPDTTIRK
jgi:hypothetical protein